jgi:hypothetical protein
MGRRRANALRTISSKEFLSKKYREDHTSKPVREQVTQ